MYTFMMKLVHSPNSKRSTLIRNVMLLDICDEQMMEELEDVSKDFKLLSQYECQDKKSKGVYCRAVMEIIDNRTKEVVFPNTEYFLSRECVSDLRGIVEKVDEISREHLEDIENTEKLAEGGFIRKNGEL